MIAERAVIEIELVPDLIVDGLRDADCTGLGQRFEPGGDVNAVTEDIAAVDDYVAEIDADAHLQPAFERHRVVDGVRRPLHLDGAAQRVDDTCKIRQQAVSGGADDSPPMRCDQRVDGAAQLPERSMRAGLVLAHQPAEPDHIRMQNGGELPLLEVGFEGFGHPPSSEQANIGVGLHRQCVLPPSRATGIVYRLVTLS
jgi:hypothetical protein